MARRPPRRWWSALLLVALVAARPAIAHEPSAPLGVDVKLGLDRIDVVVRHVIFAADEASSWREQLDRDADGALDQAERRALAEVLAGRALALVAIGLGDAELTLTTTQPARLFIDERATGPIAVAVAASAAITIGRAPAVLRIFVRGPDARTIAPVSVGARSKRVLLPEGFSGGEASPGAPLEITVRRR